MNWIDAHCHLADKRFTESLESVLERSRQAGVSQWIQGGVGPSDWERQVALAKKHAGIYPTFGLHPWWVAQSSPRDIEGALARLADYLSLPQCLAVGEMGMDLTPPHRKSQALQSCTLQAQIALAQRFQKPIILHCVRAHTQILSLLDSPYPYGGIVHAFSGPWSIAREYLDRNITLSFCGTLTREAFPEWIARLAPHSWVMETDAPDQLPYHLRHVGLLNEPAHLVAIASFLAAKLGVTPESLLDRSRQNLKQLFAIEPPL